MSYIFDQCTNEKFVGVTAIRGLWRTLFQVSQIAGEGRARQGNRVKKSGSDEACEEIIVPAGGFALEALRVLAGHFPDEIVCHVL